MHLGFLGHKVRRMISSESKPTIASPESVKGHCYIILFPECWRGVGTQELIPMIVIIYVLWHIRSYGFMRVGIPGVVVSALCKVVAVKGNERGATGEKRGKRIPTQFAYASWSNGPVFLSRC
jgi:hypothetical protein